jgi:hypothetical protein
MSPPLDAAALRRIVATVPGPSPIPSPVPAARARLDAVSPCDAEMPVRVFCSALMPPRSRALTSAVASPDV